VWVAAVIMCLAETRVKLDPSEFSAIVQLCITCCECVKSPSEGLEIRTFGTYPGLPCLWLWNSRFFSIDSTGAAMLWWLWLGAAWLLAQIYVLIAHNKNLLHWYSEVEEIRQRLDGN
jgi:hypothetical protein